MSKKRKIGIIVVAILAIVAVSTIVYVNDYYHSMPYATEVLVDNVNVSSNNVSITETDDYVYFKYENNTNNNNISNISSISNISNNAHKKTTIKKGLIFYPGGKVAYESYAPFAKELSEKGYEFNEML